MTNTLLGYITVGFLALALVGALIWAVEFDQAGVMGCSIGALFGVANLVLGLRITARAMQRGDSKALMATITSGFLIRFFVLAVLIVLFHFTEPINEVAFALTFLIFFMLFMCLEVRLVEKSLRRSA